MAWQAPPYSTRYGLLLGRTLAARQTGAMTSPDCCLSLNLDPCMRYSSHVRPGMQSLHIREVMWVTLHRQVTHHTSEKPSESHNTKNAQVNEQTYQVMLPPMATTVTASPRSSLARNLRDREVSPPSDTMPFLSWRSGRDRSATTLAYLLLVRQPPDTTQLATGALEARSRSRC